MLIYFLGWIVLIYAAGAVILITAGTAIYDKVTHNTNCRECMRVKEILAKRKGITKNLMKTKHEKYFDTHMNIRVYMEESKSILVGIDYNGENFEIIDVSNYNPPRIPSKTWRESIKRIWEIDPLQCPHCGGSMKIISFITDKKIIKNILEHLDLWRDKPSRDPPRESEDPPNKFKPLY